MKQAVIFCAGELEDLSFYHDLPISKDAFLVCADGGYRHAKALGLTPHMILGDFDSNEEELPCVPKLTYPVRKDATDSYLAVDYCLEQGCEELWILGGVGSRWDHSVSNFYLLKYIHSRGAKGILRNENNEVFLISSEVTLKKREDWYLSLLPFGGDAKGVTVTGVSYPVENETYSMESSLGISNEITEKEAEIRVKDGFLLGFFSCDKEKMKKKQK